MPPDPWAEFRGGATAAPRAPANRAPTPVFTAPRTATQEAEEARRNAEEGRQNTSLGNDMVRTGIAERGEGRDVDNTRFQHTQTLRGQFLALPEVKEYSTIAQQFAGAVNAPLDAAGDQALITAYAKMLDPNSVVREGEYAITAQADNTLNQAITRLEREFGRDEAGRISPLARQRLIGSMRNLAVQRVRAYDQLRRDYTQMAESHGIDPFEVIGTHAASPYLETLRESDRARGIGVEEPAATAVPSGGGGPVISAPEGPGSGLYFDANGTPFTAAQEADLTIPAYDENGEYVLRGRITDESPVNDPTADMGILEGIGESITGNARSTPEIEALPDWATMPELNSLSGDSFMAALGTMMSDPEETALILQRRFPQMQVRQDANGNFILRSPTDGQEYGIRPGFRMSDVPRAAGAMAAFTPAGRAATYGGTALASAGTQAAVEATQSAAGGRFDTGEIATAGAAGIGGRAVERLAGRVTSAVRSALPSRAAQAAPLEAEAAQAAQPPLSARGQGPEQPAPPRATPTAANDEIGDVARQAVDGNPLRPLRRNAAKRELASRAQPNPEAAAAAERLGMEAPLDVLSDDAQLQALTGLARSQVNSEASAAWNATLARNAAQSEKIIADLGASTDLAQVSDDVLRRMNEASDSLQRQAAGLREQVDAAITPGERVAVTSLEELVAEMINDYGSLAEAKAAMTPIERSLLQMLGEGEEAIRPTYARVNRIRNEVGEALNKGKGPWADVNRANLTQYYRALSDDQLAAVEQMGGPEIATAQRAANTLFAQMYDQRAATQEVFGRQLTNSLAPVLRRAVTQGAKGDARTITRIMERIPEDMRGPALMTAIVAQSRSSASHGGFSFTNFAKTYRGLRENGPIFSQVAQNIGPEGTRILSDLYTIANRMASAETHVLRTGKANQGMSGALNAESVVSQVLSAAASRTATAGGAAAGGLVAGPGGAAGGAALGEALTNATRNAGKTRLDKVHGLISSSEFGTLVESIARGGDTASARNRLYATTAFHRFAKSIGLATPEARREWLGRLTEGGNLAGSQQVLAGQLEQSGARVTANQMPLAAEQTQSEDTTSTRSVRP